MSDAKQPSSSNPQIPPEVGERLIMGEITPAQAVGIPREGLYAIAKRGHEQLNSGNLQTALDIFRGLVAADPHDAVFHCNLAAVLVRLEQYEEAKAEYTRALELNIAYVDAMVGRSEIYLREGKVPEALKDIEAAITADPEAKRENTKRARATLMMLKKVAEESTKQP